LKLFSKSTAVRFGKNLFLLSLPVLITLIGLLRADGVAWAAILCNSVVLVVTVYLLLFAPKTISYLVVCLSPWALFALGLLGIFLWHYHWLWTVFIGFLIRSLFPIVSSCEIEGLKLRLAHESKRENLFLINLISFFLADDDKPRIN